MFAAALRHFDGDVLLQIQADASADDWSRVVSACRKRHRIPEVGVGAPEIEYTPRDTPRVRICPVTGTRVHCPCTSTAVDRAFAGHLGVALFHA